MDPGRHKVQWDGKDVTLTVTEFLILEALAQRPGVVKTRNQLLDIAYHEESMSTTGRSTATSSGSAGNSAPPTPNSMRSRPFMASDTDSTTNERIPTSP